MNVAGAQLADPFEKDLLKAQAAYPGLASVGQVERAAAALIDKVTGWLRATGLSELHRQHSVLPEHCDFTVIAQVRRNPSITRPMCLCNKGSGFYNGARTNAEALLDGAWRILDPQETRDWYAKTEKETKDSEARRVQAVAVSTGAAAMEKAADVLSRAAETFAGKAGSKSVREAKE